MLSYTSFHGAQPAGRKIPDASGSLTAALDATPLTVSTGGVKRYTLELAAALARCFPEDRYWLLSDQPFDLPPCSPANLQAGSEPRSAVERKWWSWGLTREMARHSVDLFHGTDFAVPYLPRRPAVMTVHDLSPWMQVSQPESGPEWQPDGARVRRRTPRLLRWKLATMVITPSQAIRRQAIERFGLNPERVVAVPLAAREWFKPVARASAGVAQESEAAPYFLFVGTLEPRKNLARLIEAWRYVRRQHAVDLVLAGRARADFQQLQPEPGLHLLGAVADDELPRLYSGALAVVYPSLYEGFGLPVLEAMQCGALVITSRDPAILEVTGGAGSASGSAAVHVDADNVHGLAEAMCAAAASCERFAEVRQRALVRAREFSWESTARQTREVYDAARRLFQ